MDVVRRIYGIVRVVLAVFLAIEVVGAVYVVLHVPSIRAQFARDGADEREAEAATYCTRWGFTQGTYEYGTCAVDLDQIREHERARNAE